MYNNYEYCFSQGNQDSVEAQGPNIKRTNWNFMPKSHTCSNTLNLPIGNRHLPLPSEEDLFQLYDLAFKNTYFGIM